MEALVSPYIARQFRALDDELGPTIPRATGGTDDEAIHDLRVAIRRIRTLLKLVRPIYGRFHTDAVRDAFTQLHRATGAMRDEEVLEETLADVDVPAFTPWRTRRKARERALRRGVVAHLKTPELPRARTLLEALIALPVKPARDKDLAKFARRVIERARGGVESRRDTPTTDVVGLHELRIAYKELRYAAELFAEALPTDLAAMAGPAAKFQKRLGEIHDLDMALMTIRRARGLALETRALVIEKLEAERAKAIGKYEGEMGAAVVVAPVTA
jgi:CHAD domain-containing protein